jgi:hypothetical protein
MTIRPVRSPITFSFESSGKFTSTGFNQSAKITPAMGRSTAMPFSEVIEKSAQAAVEEILSWAIRASLD